MQKRKRKDGKEPRLPQTKRCWRTTRSQVVGNPINESSFQRLPNDILWYIARTFFWEPTEVYDLARTSQSLWDILQKEIYITDVFAVRHCTSHGLEAPRTTLAHWASLAGRTDILQKSIEAARLIWTPYLDYQHTRCGHAAIHFAAHYGQLKAVEMLEEAGSVDVTSPSGWMCPAPQHLNHIFERLTPGQFRIPPDYMLGTPALPFKIDALGLAVLKGHRDVALHLMRYYDEERARTDLTFSPLHLAAFVGMEDIVSAIIQKGTDVNSLCRHVVNSTALQWAAAGKSDHNRVKILKFLVDAGADMTVRDTCGRTALDWAIGFKVPGNVLWMLWRAVKASAPGRSAGQIEECTKRLQRCMADDCLLDSSKFIMQYYPQLPEDCLKLCAHSTFWDIDESWDEPGSISTASKNRETKRWLVEENIGLGILSMGARQSWMQEELFVGRSFLHYAAGSTDINADLLETVVKHRAQDIDVLDVKGLSPLELALGYRRDTAKVQLLLRSGANPLLCYGGERARADVDRQIQELAMNE